MQINFKKTYNFLLGATLFMYPLGIYGLTPLDFFRQEEDSYFISFAHIFLIIFNLSIVPFITRKKFYLLILMTIFTFLPLITFDNNLQLSNLISYKYYGSINTLLYIFLLFTFGLIVFDKTKYNNVLFFFKIILLAILISSLFHILQFLTFVIFKYKFYAIFCDQITFICNDSYSKVSKYNYMGELMRSSGLGGATNRSVSYLIPGLYISILFFNKTKNNIFNYIYLCILLAVFSTLSRLGLILALISLYLFIFNLLRENNLYKNIKKKISLNNLKFTIIFIFFLIFFVAVSLGDKFDPFNYRNVNEYTRSFQNIIFAIMLSFENYGLGVGYHIIDDYLYINTDIDLWGSHSNLVQLIGGFGIFFLIILIYLLFNNFNKINLEKNINIVLSFIVISFFIMGILKTYFLNPYGVFFLSIFLKILYVNQDMELHDNRNKIKYKKI